MKLEKNMAVKEIDSKVSELKIEMLKQPTKKKSIKRQIAKLLTMKNQNKTQTKSGGKK